MSRAFLNFLLPLLIHSLYRFAYALYDRAFKPWKSFVSGTSNHLFFKQYKFLILLFCQNCTDFSAVTFGSAQLCGLAYGADFIFFFIKKIGNLLRRPVFLHKLAYNPYQFFCFAFCLPLCFTFCLSSFSSPIFPFFPNQL